MNSKQNIIDAEQVEEKGLTIHEPQSLDKPQHDTEFASEAAKFLVDIIKKNGWSHRLGGKSEHVSYEGWQTAGKYYGHTVKTFDAEYVELGGTWGFKAKAVVVNENTGVEIGSAEAYCMSDEGNWRNKPKFQLASMAQTRAGSKALRQNLGFVVALAGYSPTPVEEMTGDEHNDSSAPANGNSNGHVATEKQINFIHSLLKQKGYTEEQLKQKYEVSTLEELTADQASTIIGNLQKIPAKK